MICPLCKSDYRELKVKSTRDILGTPAVERSYTCHACEGEFKTLEVVSPNGEDVQSIFNAFSVIEQQYKKVGVLMRAIAARTPKHELGK